MVIVEKPAKEAGRNASHYVHSLARYMETAKRGSLAEDYGLTLAHYMISEKDAGQEPSAERVLATGALVSGRHAEWDAALAEVNARMAKRSSRSKKPARHLIGSVHVDEDITHQACDDMAAALADELGCEAGIILWALHGDTNNRHLHFLVLTLDQNGAATPFGRDGRSHEAMQRVIARVEHGHGFKREPGARYEVRDGEVQRLPPVPKPAKVRAPVATATRQWEAETGLESFTRYAQEVLAPLIDAADSWDEVQSALAPLGARIMKAGSGGKIESTDGHHKVKLAKVDRSLTWGKLIERWGAWSEPTIDAVPYEPRILDPERALHWARRDEQAEACHSVVQARIDRLKIERKKAIDTAQREHRQRRADLAALHGDPQDLARLRQGMDALQRRRIARLRQEYSDRIAALRELRGEIADAERFDDLALDDIAAFERSLSIDWACRPAQLVAPPGFAAEVVGQSVHYWRDDIRTHRPAFVERGDRIWINDDSDIAIRAALIVAQARYGVVAARGDAAFVAQAQRLGRELGIEVQDCTVDAAPQTRARSPRIRQRRDAVQHWQATADARQHEPMPAAGDRHARGDVAHGPARQSTAVTGDRRYPAMSDAARQAILARVHRLLADDDWDPRDYHRTAAGKGRRGSQQGKDITDRSGRHRPSAASRQAQIDAAGRGG